MAVGGKKFAPLLSATFKETPQLSHKLGGLRKKGEKGKGSSKFQVTKYKQVQKQSVNQPKFELR